MYKVDRMGGYKEAFTDHLTGLFHTPGRLKARAFKRRTLESQLVQDKRESGVEMVRKLWWMDMVSFSLLFFYRFTLAYTVYQQETANKVIWIIWGIEVVLLQCMDLVSFH